MAVTNPNNANQYQTDPRQKLCWDLYADPRSETFGNALQSAIKAGYEESYASVITTRPWFEEKVRRLNMLSKAERNLDKVLDMEVEEEGKVNPQLLKIKTEVSTTIAKTLGKKIYSERSELTGENGKDLFPKPILAYVIPSDDGNQKGNESPEAIEVYTGGDISE